MNSTNTPFTGVIDDPRSDEEKSQDYIHDEIAGAMSPVVWDNKDPANWKKYSIRDQDGSSSCIEQGISKAIETISGVIVSAHPNYRRRSNYPAPGMYLQNGFDLAKGYGTTTELLDPSQMLNEDQMNADVKVATPILESNYVFVAVNIDQIAQVIENFKHCVLVVKSTYPEWQGVPVADPASTNFWQHCICAVDYFMYGGSKCLLIDDSWGHATSIGNGGQRVLTEAFINARVIQAGYLIPKVADPVVPAPQKPSHTFSQPLHYGMTNSADVIALQKVLQYEGFLQMTLGGLPLPLGNFYTMTSAALKKWQVAHGIMDFANQNDMTKINFGKKSIALANSLYGGTPSDPVPPLVVPTPVSDKIHAWATAIQHREGYFAPGQDSRYPHGTPSYLNNNPGNIKYVGQKNAKASASGFCIFPTYADGWNALTTMLINACTGKSTVHPKTETIREFYQGILTQGKYIDGYAPASDGNDPISYSNDVATAMGVPVTTRLQDLYTPSSAEELPDNNQNTMLTFLQNLVSSSTGSGKYSATLRGILVLLIPVLIQIGKNHGIVITENDIMNGVSMISQIVGTGLLVIGLIRKFYIWLTTAFKPATAGTSVQQ